MTAFRFVHSIVVLALALIACRALPAAAADSLLSASDGRCLSVVMGA